MYKGYHKFRICIKNITNYKTHRNNLEYQYNIGWNHFLEENIVISWLKHKNTYYQKTVKKPPPENCATCLSKLFLQMMQKLWKEWK